MTEPEHDMLSLLRGVNAASAFNTWAGFQIIVADPGLVELRMTWRADFGQHAGFLHAGMVTALIDTASGYAGVTSTGGNVTASHCAVSYLAPARGTPSCPAPGSSRPAAGRSSSVPS